MSVYSKVPITKPGRNAFNLSHSFKGSINIGELVPIARPMECVPGDTFITGNISQVELNPIVTNFKGELYFETWQFFVSNDMLYTVNDSGKFTEILASMQNQQSILSLPYISAISQKERSILGYLYGIPKGVSTNGQHIIAYPERAYRKIVNEWFRDENLESEYTYLTLPVNGDFYHINYKKDRYTSAFLTTQKGTPVSIGSVFDSTLMNAFSTHHGKTTGRISVDPSASTDGVIFHNGESTSPFTVNDAHELNEQFTAALNNAFIGPTINDLRLGNKLQRWLERCQLCGSRTYEYLLSNYGVVPNDETLQRPVLIGHTKVPVIVNDIIANIKAENRSGQTLQNEQGSRGGYASANSTFSYGKWFCKEFGWIITLGALRPKSVYTKGVHKSLFKDSIIDFFNPIFEHLGQQAVLNKELLLTGTVTSDNNIFGYQDIYNEMRHLEDYIAEDLLKSGYQTKNIFRIYGSTPTLSRSFIEVKPADYDYLFAVPYTTAPHAFFESANIVKAIRPITKRSIPSL